MAVDTERKRNTNTPMLSFRVSSPDELHTIRASAAAAGMSVSSFIKRAVFKDIEKESARKNR